MSDKIRVAIKPNNVWMTLPCFAVGEDFQATYGYFSIKDFKPTLSSASISLNLRGDILNIFLSAKDSFPCQIEINDRIIFGGWLENVFSTQENLIAQKPSYLTINFQIKDWLTYFDYSISEAFNPFASLDVVNSIPICDPLYPGKSILHMLFDFFEIPFRIDTTLAIPETTRSFVIKENENILKSLQSLFWGIGRFFRIVGDGIFTSDIIQTESADPDKMRKLRCVESFSYTRPKKEATDILVEWASVIHKSAALLEAEKKSIYSEVGQYDQKENKVDPLVILAPDTYYPDASATSEVWTKPKVDFLKIHYDTSLISQGIFGTKGRENKDISIVALWGGYIKAKFDDDIVLDYLRQRSDSFAFRFHNTLPRPVDGEDWGDRLRYLWYLDYYADTMYRQLKNKIFKITERMRGYRSIGDITSRPLQANKEILLKFVNDHDTAKRFFDAQNNLNENSKFNFSFNTIEDYEPNTFLEYPSPTGVTYKMLIVSKKIQFDSSLKSYIALNSYPHKEYEGGSEGSPGGDERPPIDFIYNVSNIYDGYDSFIKTNYLNDENTLISIDNQVITYGGIIRLMGGLFFVSTRDFKAQIQGLNGSTFRKRPMSQAIVTEESTVAIENRIGLSIKMNVKLSEDTLIKSGDKRTAFKFA